MLRSYLKIHFADWTQEAQEVEMRRKETKANRVFENGFGV